MIYGETRKEVAAQLTGALHDHDRGTIVTRNKLTLRDWLGRWLEDYKKPSLRPVSDDSYEMLARQHLKPALGHISLKDLRPDQVQRLDNDKREAGLSVRTIRYIHTVLHGALKQALKNQLVVRNVSESTTLLTGKTRTMRPLTLEQVNQLLTTIKGDRLFAAILLEKGTGLRRGELLGLRWQDVDLDAEVVHIRQALVRVGNHGAIAGNRKTRLIFQEPKTDQSRRTALSLRTSLVN